MISLYKVIFFQERSKSVKWQGTKYFGANAGLETPRKNNDYSSAFVLTKLSGIGEAYKFNFGGRPFLDEYRK